MGPIAAIASVAGTLVAGYGAYQSYENSKKEQTGNSQLAALSSQEAQQSLLAEQARQQQMNLDASRQMRATHRQAVIASASATARSVGAGASAAVGMQSSGLQGATSQIAAQQGYGIGNIGQNQQIGTQIFTAQENIFADKSQGALIQGNQNYLRSQGALDAQLYNTGVSLVGNAGKAQANWTSLWSAGSGGGSTGGGNSGSGD